MRRRTFFQILLLSTTLFTLSPITARAAQTNNELIITYKAPVQTTDLTQITAINHDAPEQLNDTSVLVDVSTATDMAKTLNVLQNDVDVANIQPNFTYHLTGGESEPFYRLEWYVNNNGSFIDQFYKKAVTDVDMNVKEAWDQYTPERTVIVAVIDTGIDYAHPDLEQAMWTNVNEKPNDGIDNDGNGYIDDIYGWNFFEDTGITYSGRSNDDHGTHVSGIIAAAQNQVGIAGIASNSNVKIMTLQALGGRDGSGSTDSLIKAIGYAEQMGVSICNISAGTFSYDAALEDAMRNSKMVFVVAAGNGDEDGNGLDNDISPTYPASYDLDNIISVANIDCTGELHSSSNYGVTSVDIAAPGTSIWSTIAKHDYGYFTGTSMATPMVTGVLAMIESNYSGITPMQAKTILLSTARPLPSLSGYVATGGIPDAYAALSIDLKQQNLIDTQAPQITTSLQRIPKSNDKSLNIQILDTQDLVPQLRYSLGDQPLSFFSGTQNGTALTPVNGYASIRVKNTSDFTLYGIDQSGNETLVHVNVTIQKPVSVTLPATKSAASGKSFYLKPSLSPADVFAKFSYSSSNRSVATVTSYGKVTTRKIGTTTITVKTSNGLKDSCRLTVK